MNRNKNLIRDTALLESILSLQDATNNDNIDSTDAAQIKATIMKNIEKFINNNHSYSDSFSPHTRG